MFEILKSFFTNFDIQSSSTFYVGRKKTPISLRKTNQGYSVKLGSGFVSYTLDTNKVELQALSDFVLDFIQNNP